MSEHPWLRILRGTPTDEELAALVGVLASRAAAATVDAPVPSRWARSARPGARTGWPR